MNEYIRSNPGSSEDEKSPLVVPRKRSGWLPVIVLAGVFLVGFGPMWLKSSRLNGELFRAQRQSRVELIEITFANAALDAPRGEYESARQGMSSFFSLVTAELNRGIGSALPASANDGLKPLLAQRDGLITLLARGDSRVAAGRNNPRTSS